MSDSVNNNINFLDDTSDENNFYRTPSNSLDAEQVRIIRVQEQYIEHIIHILFESFDLTQQIINVTENIPTVRIPRVIWRDVSNIQKSVVKQLLSGGRRKRRH